MPAPASNPRPAHMGTRAVRSSGLRRRAASPLAFACMPDPAQCGRTDHQGCGARRFADRGLSASRPGRLPGAARTGAQGQGLAVEVANAGVSGDTSIGRSRPARLVGPGGHRCRDPRARRQRHAARHRSQDHARRAGQHRPPSEGPSHRGVAVRHAGRAQSRSGLCARNSTRSIPSLPRRTVFFSTRSFWMGSWAIPSSYRRRPASDRRRRGQDRRGHFAEGRGTCSRRVRAKL